MINIRTHGHDTKARLRRQQTSPAIYIFVFLALFVGIGGVVVAIKFGPFRTQAEQTEQNDLNQPSKSDPEKTDQQKSISNPELKKIRDELAEQKFALKKSQRELARMKQKGEALEKEKVIQAEHLTAVLKLEEQKNSEARTIKSEMAALANELTELERSESTMANVDRQNRFDDALGRAFGGGGAGKSMASSARLGSIRSRISGGYRRMDDLDNQLKALDIKYSARVKELEEERDRKLSHVRGY